MGVSGGWRGCAVSVSSSAEHSRRGVWQCAPAGRLAEVGEESRRRSGTVGAGVLVGLREHYRGPPSILRDMVGACNNVQLRRGHDAAGCHLSPSPSNSARRHKNNPLWRAQPSRTALPYTAPTHPVAFATPYTSSPRTRRTAASAPPAPAVCCSCSCCCSCFCSCACSGCCCCPTIASRTGGACRSAILGLHAQKLQRAMTTDCLPALVS